MYNDFIVSDLVVIEMKNARTTQKEQTRALLIQTAYDVFCEKGIMLTRASDIAKAAHVSHGTVFVHFATMDALIEEVVEVYGRKIALRTHELAYTQGCLAQLLRAHLDGIMEFEPFYIRLVLENQLLPPGARDAFVGIQSVVSLHFSNVLAFERTCTSEIPPYFLFNLWVGLVHHYLSNKDLFSPQCGVLRRHGDMLINSFLKLVEKRVAHYGC